MKDVRLLKNVFDAVEEGLLLIDRSGKVYSVNKSFLDIFQFTFAKKQPSESRNIDPNVIIVEMLKLLEKIIGENIKITLNLDRDIKTINIDPTMFEQIILNLSINARDAMPEGGRLIIETNNVYLDDDYLKTHYHAEKGNYVKISVSDSRR